MAENTQIPQRTPLFGCLTKAAVLALFIGLFSMIASSIMGGPKITLQKETLGFLAWLFFIVFLLVVFWTTISVWRKKASGRFNTGIYKYARHPASGAVIFLLLPLFAILLKNWMPILDILPVYLIWRALAKEEEKKTEEVLGEEYIKYKKTSWRFIPNLLTVSKPAFFAATILAVFVVSFVVLNFSALYLRAVGWEGGEPPKAVIDKPVPNNNVSNNGANGRVPADKPAGQLPRPKPLYDKPNSIIIPKMNIEAPMVLASGTSQKELNSALDQGVVLYPESKLPGQLGEVFLTGHSSTYPWNKTPYGQVFTLLDKLEPGDIVTVYYNKEKFEYKITGKTVLKPDLVGLSEQTDKKTIALMTCWPIGTALKRLMVYGEEIK